MRFIEAMDGTLYPTKRITRIGRTIKVPYHGHEIAAIRVEIDEEWVNVAVAEVERLKRSPTHVLPAEPGTFMIWGEAAENLVKTPVIGWAVNYHGVEPITPDGINDDCDDWPDGILMPTGHVIRVADSQWSSLESYFSDMQARREATESARASADAAKGPSV